MKRWGVIVTAFYAFVIVFLLLPAAVFIAGADDYWNALRDSYTHWLSWLVIGLLVCGQALLLFVSVDTSWRKLKPRAHILVSVIVSAMLLGLLTLGIIWSVGAVYSGEKIFDWPLMNSEIGVIVPWAVLWLIWGSLFYMFVRQSSDVVTKAISWLLRGSILELLVAVPSHIIVRRRGDCSAPIVTSFGIATGIAIMLLSFGPSVLFLYKKRMDDYSRKRPKERPDNQSNFAT